MNPISENILSNRLIKGLNTDGARSIFNRWFNGEDSDIMEPNINESRSIR